MVNEKIANKEGNATLGISRPINFLWRLNSAYIKVMQKAIVKLFWSS